jgi:two-component system nitrogen regulation sensor histidine kinase NtrY
MLGKTEHRLALVILVTALLPLASAMFLAYALLNSASAVWLRPEVEQELERGIDLYKAYVRVVKDDMKDQAAAMAETQSLRDAAKRHDRDACVEILRGLLPRHGELVSLEVTDESEQMLARQDRGRPPDDATERRLEVRRPLGTEAASPTLIATFAFDRRYEQELERAGEIHSAYAQLQKERGRVYAGYYEAFAVLLAITVVATMVLGFFLARGITKRIRRLANAIHEVTVGHLEVRVPVTGSDELTELARVFNRMLSEMQQSRARIEYLQRIGAWQEMAQRLAHEIKNPLTPIQLAVQECHRKYMGDDLRFRALLDTTLEIVEEEVGTLRRLVGNFSSFARLPHAELREASLRDFLRECAEQLAHLSAELPEEGGEDVIAAQDVDVRWELPDEPMPVAIDRQMLRRVLVNLVRNAVEAIREARPSLNDGAARGHVIVRAERSAEGFDLLVEDDGPGVPEASRERIFDPYFTTKAEGTGLGLAIVKKVVVEHTGVIAARHSERLGGAALVVTLPFARGPAFASASEGDPRSALAGRAIQPSR